MCGEGVEAGEVSERSEGREVDEAVEDVEADEADEDIEPSSLQLSRMKTNKVYSPPTLSYRSQTPNALTLCPLSSTAHQAMPYKLALLGAVNRVTSGNVRLSRY